MRSVASADIEIELADFHNPPSETALFILTTDDCNREFKRLVNTHFASGGRIVPNEQGRLDIFEYPAGANFMMEDPSGNRFLIHEDFGPSPDDVPSHGDAKYRMQRTGADAVDVDNLIRQDNLLFDDCVVVGNSKVIGFSRIDKRIVIDETIVIDASDLSDIDYLFSQEIDGSNYAGGEASDHGSYGFFFKKTGDVLDWALMSTGSNPFCQVEVGSGSVRFLSTSGEAWIVPDNDITKVFVEAGSLRFPNPHSILQSADDMCHPMSRRTTR